MQTQEYFPPSDADTLEFYEQLAPDYGRQFVDWQRESAEQATVLDRLIRGGTGARYSRVLDCACGIGTQAVGLARLGYAVHGTDISPTSIARARQAACSAGLAVTFQEADFRDLRQVQDGFDAVLCCDNALPHMLTDDDMLSALSSIHRLLSPGGLLLASIRDYDGARAVGAAGQAPRIYTGRDGVERLVLQVWHWLDEEVYLLRHLTLQRDEDRWRGREYQVRYRAIQRAQLTALLSSAGFVDIRWRLPDETGYFQPVVLANAGVRR